MVDNFRSYWLILNFESCKDLASQSRAYLRTSAKFLLINFEPFLQKSSKLLTSSNSAIFFLTSSVKMASCDYSVLEAEIEVTFTRSSTMFLQEIIYFWTSFSKDYTLPLWLSSTFKGTFSFTKAFKVLVNVGLL